HVDRDQVQLLHHLRVGRGDRQRLGAGGGQRVRCRAGERPAPHAQRTGRLRGGEQVGAAPAGGQQQQDVPGTAVGAYLPREHLPVAVVVADRGRRRRLAAQGDRRQRGPVVPQLADQLGGQVLSLLGT